MFNYDFIEKTISNLKSLNFYLIITVFLSYTYVNDNSVQLEFIDITYTNAINCIKDRQLSMFSGKHSKKYLKNEKFLIT